MEHQVWKPQSPSPTELLRRSSRPPITPKEAKAQKAKPGYRQRPSCKLKDSHVSAVRASTTHRLLILSFLKYDKQQRQKGSFVTHIHQLCYIFHVWHREAKNVDRLANQDFLPPSQHYSGPFPTIFSSKKQRTMMKINYTSSIIKGVKIWET